MTLHMQWLDGTLPAPVLLDDGRQRGGGQDPDGQPRRPVDALALGVDGCTGALIKPMAVRVLSTLNTDGDVEISPTQYETFVAGYWNTQHGEAGRSQRKDQRRDGGHRSNPWRECRRPGRDGGWTATRG